jgi:hypothetical protein
VVRRAGYSTSSISCEAGFTRISSAGALVAEAKRATPCPPAFDDTVCGVVGVNRSLVFFGRGSRVEFGRGTRTQQLELESPSIGEGNGHSELVITALGTAYAHYRSREAHFAMRFARMDGPRVPGF